MSKQKPHRSTNLKRNFLISVRDSGKTLKALKDQYQIRDKTISRWLGDRAFIQKLSAMLEIAQRRNELELTLFAAPVTQQVATLLTANEPVSSDVRLTLTHLVRLGRGGKALRMRRLGRLRDASKRLSNEVERVQSLIHPNASPAKVAALFGTSAKHARKAEPVSNSKL